MVINDVARRVFGVGKVATAVHGAADIKGVGNRDGFVIEVELVDGDNIASNDVVFTALSRTLLAFERQIAVGRHMVPFYLFLQRKRIGAGIVDSKKFSSWHYRVRWGEVVDPMDCASPGDADNVDGMVGVAIGEDVIVPLAENEIGSNVVVTAGVDPPGRMPLPKVDGVGVVDGVTDIVVVLPWLLWLLCRQSPRQSDQGNDHRQAQGGGVHQVSIVCFHGCLF